MSEDYHTSNCCFVSSLFGYSLPWGVKFVAIATVVISSVTLLSSMASLHSISSNEPNFNLQPTAGIDLIFGLYSASISVYQIIISVLLFIKNRTVGNLFFTSMWFVSHLSILTFYCLFFAAKVTVYVAEKQFSLAVFTLFAAVLYQGITLFLYTLSSWLTVFRTQLMKKFTIDIFTICVYFVII